MKMHNIVVGKKPSCADSYVDSSTDVRQLLEAFMQISLKKRLSNSTYDIRSLNLQFTDDTSHTPDHSISSHDNNMQS
jgi:hypothetical protein